MLQTTSIPCEQNIFVETRDNSVGNQAQHIIDAVWKGVSANTFFDVGSYHHCDDSKRIYI